MIAARIARQASPAPRRGIVGTILLHRIEWTDKNPWAPALGVVLVGVLGAVLNVVLR
jgi:hypothetical protein